MAETQLVDDQWSLALATSLIAQFDERNHPPVDASDLGWAKFCEAAWLSQREGLRHVPFNRWLSLCATIDHDPVLLAAAPFCEGYDASGLASVIASAKWFVWPNSRAARIAALAHDNEAQADGGLAQWIKETSYANTLAWRLAAAEHCPPLDITTEGAVCLHDAPASMLAWLFARDGFGKEVEPWLIGWAKKQGEPQFWATFALVLRRSIYHDQVNVVVTLAGDDPVRQSYATALGEAIRAGCYTPATARADLYDWRKGSRADRLVRAMRLAAFLPGQAPLVDPNMPSAWQSRAAGELKQHLDKAISSGASSITRRMIYLVISSARSMSS